MSNWNVNDMTMSWHNNYLDYADNMFDADHYIDNDYIDNMFYAVWKCSFVLAWWVTPFILPSLTSVSHPLSGYPIHTLCNN